MCEKWIDIQYPSCCWSFWKRIFFWKFVHENGNWIIFVALSNFHTRILARIGNIVLLPWLYQYLSTLRLESCPFYTLTVCKSTKTMNSSICDTVQIEMVIYIVRFKLINRFPLKLNVFGCNPLQFYEFCWWIFLV